LHNTEIYVQYLQTFVSSLLTYNSYTIISKFVKKLARRIDLSNGYQLCNKNETIFANKGRILF
jgi:hypothetical protein